MSFVIYDLVFLVLFTLIAVLFLYSKRRNLKRQGLLYLYRTRIGIKFIEWTSKKFSKELKPLQYLIIAMGYSLMLSMIYFLVKFAYFYITSPYAAKALKVPVLIPLIPYLPELFKLDFLPPFYFTYWIIIIALIAIPHEFAHGIIARINKVKIHSTGFGFLGPFLAAFVEPDEKEMNKKSKFSQLSVLAAGTFANVLVTLLFLLVLWAFFASAFSAAGVNFNTYSTSIVNMSDITHINGESIQKLGLIDIPENMTFVSVSANNITYFTNPIILEESISSKLDYIVAYENTPAFVANLSSPLVEIDGVKTDSYSALSSVLSAHSPGDSVIIKSLEKGIVKEYNITLSERDEKAFLGIGMASPSSSGISGKLYSIIGKVKDPFVYYQSSLGDFGIFIYDLLWWIILINLSVALVNMIPVGIFDGGRFFYLTVWGITGNEKIGRNAFKVSTWIILGIVALLMVKWLFAIV